MNHLPYDSECIMDDTLLPTTGALPVSYSPGAAEESESSRRQAAAHRLLTLLVNGLGCSGGSIIELVAENERQHVMALVGSISGMDAAIRECVEGRPFSLAFTQAEQRNALREGKPFVLNLAWCPESPAAALPGQMLIVPMLLETRLVGFITLHYADAMHILSFDELALVEAIGKFAVVGIEQEWLRCALRASEEHEQALREANQLMGEFLGIAGHEIRTPLTSIKGNIQLARRQLALEIQEQSGTPASISRTAEDVQLLLSRAENQMAVLNRLVQDLLDVSLARANRFELHLAVCDLNALVRDTVNNLSNLPSTHTISCEIVPDGPLPVMADADRIGQVVQNYLSNAIKYSASDKPIFVRAERIQFRATPDDVLNEDAISPGMRPVPTMEVRVSVRDEGPGIVPEEQERIWERFYRVRDIAARSGAHAGLGLGLHICRIIIERHGGRVGIESIVGQGSTFWFTLPLL